MCWWTDRNCKHEIIRQQSQNFRFTPKKKITCESFLIWVVLLSGEVRKYRVGHKILHQLQSVKDLIMESFNTPTPVVMPMNKSVGSHEIIPDKVAPWLLHHPVGPMERTRHSIAGTGAEGPQSWTWKMPQTADILGSWWGSSAVQVSAVAGEDFRFFLQSCNISCRRQGRCSRHFVCSHSACCNNTADQSRSHQWQHVQERHSFGSSPCCPFPDSVHRNTMLWHIHQIRAGWPITSIASLSWLIDKDLLMRYRKCSHNDPGLTILQLKCSCTTCQQRFTRKQSEPEQPQEQQLSRCHCNYNFHIHHDIRGLGPAGLLVPARSVFNLYVMGAGFLESAELQQPAEHLMTIWRFLALSEQQKLLASLNTASIELSIVPCYANKLVAIVTGCWSLTLAGKAIIGQYLNHGPTSISWHVEAWKHWPILGRQQVLLAPQTPYEGSLSCVHILHSLFRGSWIEGKSLS